MSATVTETPAPSNPEEAWRGRLAEQQQDNPIDEDVSRRREARTLLGELLRPYRRAVALLAGVVVLENLTRLSVPYLVGLGIDDGVPPIRRSGDSSTLWTIVAVLCVIVLTQATSRRYFLRRSGHI